MLNKLLLIINNEINFRSLRERVLLLVTGVIVIFTFFHWGLLESLDAEKQKLKENVANAKLINQETNTQLAVLEQNNKKNTIAQPSNLNFIIKREDMPKVLAHLFANFQGLILVKFETIAEKDHGKTEKGKPLYRHDLKFTLDGDYDQLLKYLKHVENMPYQIIWKSIKYQITQFPKAKVEITFIVMSEQKNWIGL